LKTTVEGMVTIEEFLNIAVDEDGVQEDF